MSIYNVVRGKISSDEGKTPNPMSELYVWAINYYIRKGLNPIEAQERVMTLAAGVSKRVIDATSVFNLFLNQAQADERK